MSIEIDFLRHARFLNASTLKFRRCNCRAHSRYPPATWHKGCWIPGERCSAYVFRGPTSYHMNGSQPVLKNERTACHEYITITIDQRYEAAKDEEFTLQEFLTICRQDRSAYANAAERLLMAIGEPVMVDTALEPRLSRLIFKPGYRTLSGV